MAAFGYVYQARCESRHADCLSQQLQYGKTSDPDLHNKARTRKNRVSKSDAPASVELRTAYELAQKLMIPENPSLHPNPL